MEVTLIRSQYALDDLPVSAVIINVIDEATAQKAGSGRWYMPGVANSLDAGGLMSAFPGPWQVLYTGPTPPAYPDPTPAPPITVTIDGPQEPRPAYCRCDIR